jgi:hypothetical protein
MRIFLTGGTGMIGVRLIRKLRERGDEVVVLSRRPDAWTRVGQDCRVIVGDPTQAGAWQDDAAGCDAVVNLAGLNIFEKRWSDAVKAELLASRVESAHRVVEALAKSPRRADGSPKVLVNASAIGYYGPHGDEELTEDSPPGDDTLARICVEWEAAARPAEGSGVRVALVRTGVVLDREGGALKPLLLPFKMGAGGPVGSGKQYWSWIHHADEVGIVLLALDHSEAKGPINATAPKPVTSKAFGKAFGAALGRPAFLPTPAFGLRLLLGEVSGAITKGQRVLPKRALELGYRFQHPEVGAALREIFGAARVAG